MQRQRQLRNGLVAGSLLLLVVLALLLWGYSLKVRSNRIVLEKNSLLEQANEEINAQKDELERQRDMVVQQNMFIEQQNRHITGSIAYAQLIQNAVLPPDAILQNCLGEYFVIFKPKEVVSGDFYWATRLEHIVVFAVADCTGHGVPGAFTSMLGLTLLKEIVLRQEVTSPGQALDTLRNALIESLQQRFSPGAQRDGLEIALCAFDTKTRQLQFSGANIGLLIVKPNNEIQKLKPSSQPVAAHYNMKPFTTMSVQLEANDVLYIATDGFQDQFGGPQKKKFMSKNLHSLLLSVAQKPMREQKQILEHTFDNWKGNVEQIDDVTILGLKL
jgi:serine phosphatase RsbU (regulator of sigma subunit)